MCTSCGKPKGLFSHMLFDIESELFHLQLSSEYSVLASLSRRPGYRKITGILRFDFLIQVQKLLRCHVVLDVMNESFIVSKHIFDSLAVKMTNLRPGDLG